MAIIKNNQKIEIIVKEEESYVNKFECRIFLWIAYKPNFKSTGYWVWKNPNQALEILQWNTTLY